MSAAARQGLVLLYSLVFGVALGGFYDLFRLVRVILPPRTAVAFVQDIIFWCIAAVVAFACIFTFNSGVVRLAVLACMAAGWAVYYFTLGRLMLRATRRAADRVRGAVSRAAQRVLSPAGAFLRKLRRKAAGALKRIARCVFPKKRRRRYIYGGGDYDYSRRRAR